MPRTWGRVGQVNGQGGTWTEVVPDVNGDQSMIRITTLCQCLKLSIGESPFYANYGINGQQSVATQTFPDWYATQTQTQFASYFASLVINRVPSSFPPAYTVKAVCFSGAVLSTTVAT